MTRFISTSGFAKHTGDQPTQQSRSHRSHEGAIATKSLWHPTCLRLIAESRNQIQTTYELRFDNTLSKRDSHDHDPGISGRK